VSIITSAMSVVGGNYCTRIGGCQCTVASGPTPGRVSDPQLTGRRPADGMCDAVELVKFLMSSIATQKASSALSEYLQRLPLARRAQVVASRLAEIPSLQHVATPSLRRSQPPAARSNRSRSFTLLAAIAG
jgi:hypothetical protein